MGVEILRVLWRAAGIQDHVSGSGPQRPERLLVKMQAQLQCRHQDTGDSRTVGRLSKTVASAERSQSEPKNQLYVLQIAELKTCDFPCPLRPRKS